MMISKSANKNTPYSISGRYKLSTYRRLSLCRGLMVHAPEIDDNKTLH